MEHKGWICLYRKMLDWEWFSKAEMVQVFIFLLLRASVEDAKWQGKTIRRGQLITSLASISQATKLSTRQIRTCLDRLIESKQIVKKTTNKYTIITICNYESYQDIPQDKRQTSDKQTTTYKQYNNNNNITIIDRDSTQSKKFIPPTLEQVKEYCKERRNKVDAQRWLNHYTSNGWMVGKNRMKDWKAAIRTWENNGINNTTDNRKYHTPGEFQNLKEGEFILTDKFE